MPPMISNARDLGVAALRDRQGNVTAHLNRLLEQIDLPESERSLGRELALGSLRRRGSLEVILRAFLTHPDRRLPGPLRAILHVGLYQLLFLERIPDFAAVNETVEQASRLGHKRQCGFVNAILRTITRNVSEQLTGPPQLAGDVLPVSHNTYRKFNKPVFDDPQSNPVGYLMGAMSLSEKLAERWIDRFGLAEAFRIAMHANTRAPVILRVNRLKAGVQHAIDTLSAEAVQAHPHTNDHSVVLGEHCNVAALNAFREGLLQVQDATATKVVLLADPKPGMRVLDFCAAPGTKTTHLAEQMENQGSIVAVDVSEEKLSRIESNCRRLGVGIVETELADTVGSLDRDSFDLVLVDAPCSNTGVLSRRAEARWRFGTDTLGKLAKDQEFLIQAGTTFVAPGGRLVYSTCSIEPEENEQIAQRILNRNRHLHLIEEELTLPEGADDPSGWYDGGYVAIFQRR